MQKRRILSIGFFSLLLALLVGAFAWPAYSSQAAATKELYTSPGSYAYGVYVNVEADRLLQLGTGPLVSAYSGCTSEKESKDQASLANLNLKSILKADVLETKVDTSRGSNQSNANAQVKVADLNLLKDLIRIKLLQGNAHSQLSNESASSNSKGTLFADIMIGDKAIKADVAPNTKIDLSKLGYVVLNEQHVVNTKDKTSLILNLVHVYVTTQNTLSLPIGAEIVIGHAETEDVRAALPRLLTSNVDDLTLKLKAEKLVKENSGPLVSTRLGCPGGLATNHAVNLKLSNLATIGVVDEKSWGQTTTEKSESLGEFKATNIDLLGGLIHLEAVTSHAYVALSPSGQGSQQGNSELVNVRIGKENIKANVGPNTRINISGLGYVILNEQQGKTDNNKVSETVIAVHVYVNTKNTLGLEVGAELILGKVTVGAIGY